MAETVTRPRRTRKAAAEDAPKPAKKASAAKAAKAAPAAQQLAPGEDGRTRTYVALDFHSETKSYAVFVPPKDSGCVGKYYAPLGTQEIKVLLISAAEEA